MKRQTWFFLVGSLLLFAACSKYDDGPFFSFRSKKDRIAGTWVVEIARSQDGKIITNDFAGWRWTFDRFGEAAIEVYVNELPQFVTGTWQFIDAKEGLSIEWEGNLIGIPLDNEETYTILRLTADELWLIDPDNTEIRLNTQ